MKGFGVNEHVTKSKSIYDKNNKRYKQYFYFLFS